MSSRTQGIVSSSPCLGTGRRGKDLSDLRNMLRNKLCTEKHINEKNRNCDKLLTGDLNRIDYRGSLLTLLLMRIWIVSSFTVSSTSVVGLLTDTGCWSAASSTFAARRVGECRAVLSTILESLELLLLMAILCMAKGIGLDLPSFPCCQKRMGTYITERSSLGGTGLRTV